MAVPDFQSLMLPLLKFSADGEEHTMQEARDWLAKLMGLSEEDLRERLPSVVGKRHLQIVWYG